MLADVTMVLAQPVGLSRETCLHAGADVIIIIMDISKAPTLRLKAMSKHNRAHIEHIEIETVISLTNC